MLNDTVNFEHIGSLCLSTKALKIAEEKLFFRLEDFISTGTYSAPAERLVAHYLGYKKNSDKYGYYDLATEGKTYEVRLRHNGKPFFLSPSSARGTKRKLGPNDMLDVFNVVDGGFIAVDTVNFPVLDIYLLSTARARVLHERNWLTSGKLTCSDFLALLPKRTHKPILV